MRYAEANSARQVAFGPVGNPSKAAVMPAYGRFVVRLYSRFTAVRRLLARVVPRTALRAEVFELYAGLETRAQEGMARHDYAAQT